MKETLTPEEIKDNFDKFRALCEKTGDRAEPLLEMVDELGERLALCPASSKKHFHRSVAGGLVEHSLRVLNNLIKLNRAFEWNLPKESMIIAALLHDAGKLGMPGADSANDFYLPQSDDWKREKYGEEYVVNDKLPFMSTPDRTMFLLQHYGIKLTADEALAIKLNDGFSLDENKPYCLKVSPLVYGVMVSDYIATLAEKNVDFWPSEE